MYVPRSIWGIMNKKAAPVVALEDLTRVAVTSPNSTQQNENTERMMKAMT